jgi:endonuclease/exonuclease/phosphatase (EEP) superfamily protein YafD
MALNTFSDQIISIFTIEMSIKLLFRFLRLNWLEFVFILFLWTYCIVIVTEPNFIAGALNALRIPSAIIVTLITVFFLIRGNKLITTGSVIACLILFPGIWQYFRPGAAPEARNEGRTVSERVKVQSDFSMAHFNVKEHNKHLEVLIADVLQTNVDILSLQELRPEAGALVDSLLWPGYPFVVRSLDVPGFGIALYSRIPFDSTQVFNDFAFPVLMAHLTVNDKQLRIYAATTSTPTSEKGFEKQSKEFIYLADLIQQQRIPAILAGDLNAVPWSKHITEFCKRTSMIDSRKDLSATYPSQSMFVQLPIDYLLHSPNMQCLAFTTLAPSTSNHLGITGYFKIRNQ